MKPPPPTAESIATKYPTFNKLPSPFGFFLKNPPAAADKPSEPGENG
jgi:hypothetical protein